MKLKPLAALLAAVFAAPLVLASTSGVVISQVYGGGAATSGSPSFKYDYVELFNAGSAPVNLTGYSLQYGSATGTGNWSVSALNNLANPVLAPGRYLLIRQNSGTGALGADITTQDGTGTLTMAAASGKVALVSNTTALNGANPSGGALVDLVGYGSSNGFEGAATPVLNSTTSAQRKNNGCTDSDNNAADFSLGTPTLRNSATPANVCGGGSVAQPIIASCPDASSAAGVAGNFLLSATDADSRVNSAQISGTWPSGVTLGSFTAAAAAGGVATQAVNVSGAVPVGTYPLSLQWSNNDGQQASCSFNLAVAGLTPIYNIQGSGASSPLVGQTVSTRGIVTHVVATGFYLQDPLGDGDASTSDGIFVYTATTPTVAVGAEVSLSGQVAEFTAGQGTITQLKNISGLSTLSTGNAIMPTPVDLTTLAPGGLEAYEGMLVTLTGPITVQQNYFLGRFGQLTLAAGGRMLQPTYVMRPGVDAQNLASANLARAIILDDNSSAQNPAVVPYMGQDNTIRAGDTAESLTGVIDFGPATASVTGASMYRLQPTVAPVFARSNPRPLTAPAVGGNVRVASANVLNFFTTFTNGQTAAGGSGQGCALGGAVSAANCRGADNLNEFQRQIAKTVAELSTLNADVVGLMEIQNNGDVALQTLVAALNATMGAGTYAAAPLPAQGTGDDAIRVAMIYKPATLKLVGASISDNNPINNRPTFAQGFQAPNGERFAVVVNHFKSKSCSGASGVNADQGDLQGCYNAHRIEQALQLQNFINQVKTTAGTQDLVLLGDFNSYAQEDPIHTLTQDGQIVDLVGLFEPADYSYVFDGFAGRLDHGFGTASIASKVTGATSWHINADEPLVIDYNTEFNPPAYYSPTPFRSSDHDPMVLGLNLVKSIKGTNGNDVIVGTPGDDVIEGGLGRDTLTGNGGHDQFVYNTGADGLDTITDFKPGIDLLVFTGLLRNVGIVSSDPLAQGFVTCSASAGGALIGYDPDGTAGPAKSRPVVTLKGVACAAVQANSFKF